MSFNHEKYLMHHGVLGQKKGKRQYQYLDGSYTPLGRIHYGIGLGRKKRKGTDEPGDDNARRERENARKTEGLFKKFRSDPSRKLTKDDLPVNKELKQAIETYRNVLDHFDEYRKINYEFLSDKKTYEKYIDKIVDEIVKDSDPPEGFTAEQYRKSVRADALGLHEYDDSAFEMYMKDNKSRFVKLEENGKKLRENYRAAADAYAESIAGEHANDLIQTSYRGHSYGKYPFKHLLGSKLGVMLMDNISSFTDEELKDL